MRSKCASAPPADTDEITLEIEGQNVKCTRLSKVLSPQGRFTKADVTEYYIRVAPFIMPHVRHRPVTLKRYPDGVTGEVFWEKDAPSFTPEWVETFPVPRRAGGPDINYVVIQNSATLAWAANATALEFHPFLHRAPDLDTVQLPAFMPVSFFPVSLRTRLLMSTAACPRRTRRCAFRANRTSCDHPRQIKNIVRPSTSACCGVGQSANL